MLPKTFMTTDETSQPRNFPIFVWCAIHLWFIIPTVVHGGVHLHRGVALPFVLEISFFVGVRDI